jgi:uncharacterized protein YdhG (YjbR/CyaY superfamily)
MAEPRYASVGEYLTSLADPHRETIKAMLDVIQQEFPELELTLAWNVPHFRKGKHYVAGISDLKNYVAFSPWSLEVMNAHRADFGQLESTKHLIRIPLGWRVDEVLLGNLIRARLAEIS